MDELLQTKKKYLEVQNKLNNLITNDYNFLLRRMYFTSNDGSQSTFVYQATLDMLELKKTNSKLKPLMLSYLA